MIARLLVALSLFAILLVAAAISGYIVGSIEIRPPSTQEKVQRYLREHYPEYIRRLK